MDDKAANDSEPQPVPQPAPQPALEPAALEPTEFDGRVAALKAEAAALKDQLLRALAEAENVRKRGQRELADTRKYGATLLARDLLTVADNLRRALDSVPADGVDDATRTLIAGIELVERELQSAFERHAIMRVGQVGERFDPNLHEVMMQVPDAAAAPGTVVKLLQAGYLLHDRLLRPASVALASAAAQPEAPGGRVDTTA